VSQEILEGLAAIVNEVAGTPVSDITPEKAFVDDLDIDSLSMVEQVRGGDPRRPAQEPQDGPGRHRLRAEHGRIGL